MRLIDGDALIEKFNEKVDMAECLIDARTAERFATFCALADAVEEMPTVDAVEVRHGRWECGKPCPVCGENRFKGLDADIWADWEPPYCPNCGAKMNGG